MLTGRGKRLYVVEVHDVKSKFDLNKVGYNINFDAKDEQIVIKGRNVCCQQDSERTVCMVFPTIVSIRVITKLPNSEQSYKGKVKTHNYINRQISQQPENCENRNDPDLVQSFLKKWWVELDFKAPTDSRTIILVISPLTSLIDHQMSTLQKRNLRCAKLSTISDIEKDTIKCIRIALGLLCYLFIYLFSPFC